MRTRLADRGLELTSFELVRPSLEDVFLESRGARVVRGGMLAVGRKELRQVIRDRRTLAILVFIPMLFLLLYGYALNFDIRNVSLAVQDRDRSPDSRSLVSAFVNSGYFDLVADVDGDEAIGRLMDRNVARVALVIDDGMARRIANGEPATVQLLINGDNANTATTRDGLRTADHRRRIGSLPAGADGATDADRGASHLVEPGAAQRVVSRARTDSPTS